MLGECGRVLYVGKAKNLKNRLQSYQHAHNKRIIALLSKVHQIAVTVVSSEEQALSMESQLIKSHQPPYNILLKDNKSALYLTMSKAHAYPRLIAVRRQKHSTGTLGPFPSKELADKTAEHLFKMFQLRSCSDHTFTMRQRPCLQYQIGQCSAPCVGYISEKDYAQSVKNALRSMKHASSGLFDALQKQMSDFSAALEYEKAQATFEHIALLRSLQRQYHDRAPGERIDILACEEGVAQHVMIVGGQVQSSRFLQVLNPLESSGSDLLQQLLQRCYDDLPISWIPSHILISSPPCASLLVHGEKVWLKEPTTAPENQWFAVAQKSLWANSRKEQNGARLWETRFNSLQQLLNLESLESIDTVDISHHQGDQALGGIVRCTRSGFVKASYRYYYLEDLNGSGRRDDLESIEETVRRHLRRCAEKSDLPDLLLIDGGKNQLARAYAACNEMTAPPELLSIAKAPGRRSGEERLYSLTGSPLKAQLVGLTQANQSGFLLLQQTRDEAHRFVIQRQRLRQRQKSLQHPFDQCRIIGPERKKELLKQFGGWEGLTQARYEQLISCEGIGPKKASQLIDYFSYFK